MNRLRRLLYAFARLLGWLNAVQRGPGRTAARIANRYIGRGVQRLWR